jgi:hypothetical protein
VSNKVEGGLDHTRGNHVVLTQATISDLAVAAKKLGDQNAAAACGLLAHEQMHVMQRKDPAAFAALYASWGFVHAKSIATHPWLERLRWTNPDGLDLTWVFPVTEKDKTTTFVQPLALFTDGDGPRNMEDMQTIAVTLERDGEGFRPRVSGDKPVFRDLAALPEYQDLWGGTEETIHPNEIFASLFAAMIVKDKFGGPDLPGESAAAGKDFATLRAWCREHFSGKAVSPPK